MRNTLPFDPQVDGLGTHTKKFGRLLDVPRTVVSRFSREIGNDLICQFPGLAGTVVHGTYDPSRRIPAEKSAVL
jgi:hypothetical protein